jgi:predicted glycosyltransferase
MSLRVMVYSHDTFGLGNIRRMLAVSNHLLSAIPGVSVLLVTGSSMIHEFRIRPGLDYIKLPCLSRIGREEYSAKSLGPGIGQLMQIRSGLILAAARDFDPDVVLIDKKPDGVKHELRETLEHLQRHRPGCRIALVLRDILDSAEATVASWKDRKYFQTLRAFFDAVLILGDPAVFDASREYSFPADIRRRTRYCGYLRRPAPSSEESARLRARLRAGGEQQLVLVTPGGGEDGFALVQNYVAGLTTLGSVRSVIVCGPEMPVPQRETVTRLVRDNPSVSVVEFTGEMLSYMAASDVVVAMAGYNTVCEILSLNKRAVTVPRAYPVHEQWIRGERLARLGLIDAIHPDTLNPYRLAQAVKRQLAAGPLPPNFPASLDGLEGVADWVQEAIRPVPQEETAGRLLWSLVSHMS